jgi:lysophospholipase L1-like esterase
MLSCPLPPPAHITFAGDSITLGLGANEASQRWTTIVATQMQTEERNLGINGSSLQSGAPRTEIFKSGTEVIAALPTKPKQQKAFLIISYGFNDIRHQSPTFSSQRYLWNLLQSIKTARQKGYKSQEIIVASPYWFNPAVFEPQYQQPTYAPWNAATRSKQRAYRASAHLASWLSGTRFVDSFAATINMPTSDTIHPNAAGHQTIAQTMLKHLCPPD